MKKRRAFMKLAVIATGVFIMLATQTSAQVYLNDYTTLHEVPASSSTWTHNQCVYRDNATSQYYLAQTFVPAGSQTKYLGLSICDPQMNVVKSWQYSKQGAVTSFFCADMDEMEGTSSIIIVGDYIHEGVITAPFAISLNKTTGAINWFKLYPRFINFSGVEAVNNYAVITGKMNITNPADKIHGVSNSAGIIMRINSSGIPDWAYQFEDDKYLPNGYSIHNDMADITMVNQGNFIAVGNTNNFIGGNVNDIWDCDAMIVNFNANGSISSSKLLGNTARLGDPIAGGNQHIQYERAMSVTYDNSLNNVAIAGVRYEHPQTGIGQFCPTPTEWGLWAAKYNYITNTVTWSNRYQAPASNYYRSFFVKNDHDNRKNFGISYNILGMGRIITKLDSFGNVLYSRDHFVTSATAGARTFLDITRGFQFNNMMAVGDFQPDINQLNSSSGWNVEAYDNIQQNCEMVDFPVNKINAPCTIGTVEWRSTAAPVQQDNLVQKAIPVLNKIVCSKVLIAPPRLTGRSEENTESTTSTVGQDESSRRLVITIREQGPGNDKTEYRTVLFNAMGQRIMDSRPFSTTQELNLGNFTAGTYYLQVLGNNFRQSHIIVLK